MGAICEDAAHSEIHKFSYEADIHVYPTKEYLDYVGKIYQSLDFDNEYDKSRDVEHVIKSALEVKIEDLFDKYDVPVLRCLTCREVFSNSYDVLRHSDGNNYISFTTYTNSWHFDLTDKILEDVCKLLIMHY